MDKKKKAPNHDEIWDDSLLVDSWNEALEEYKKYHSIYAKGGNLKDIDLAISSQSENQTEMKTQDTSADVSGIHLSENAESSVSHPEEQAWGPSKSENEKGEEGVDGSAGPAPPPQVLLASVRDESLKKLLMSWYYAGYYTGLYEGQQGQNPVS